ncbi:hypothetical protein KIW84_UN0497 [Lathyrus oleraceus]|nr:hypothetical protein KIW84_UN0497 [Pisum sativum]
MNESALDGDGDYEEPKPSLSPQVQPKTKKLLILNLNGVYFQEVLEHKLTTHRISGELIQMNESALDGDGDYEEPKPSLLLKFNPKQRNYLFEPERVSSSQSVLSRKCTFKKFLNINSQLTEYAGELIQMNESALDGDGDYEEPKTSLSPQVQPKTKKLLILNLNGFLLRRVYFQEVLEHKLTTHRIPGELIQMNESALDGDECTFKKFLNINSQLTEYPGELIQMNESALDGDGDYEEPKPSLSPQVQPKTKKLLILNLNGFLLRRVVYFQEVLEHKFTTHRISGELIQMNESALDGDGDYEEPKPSLSPQVQPKTKKLLILNLNGFLLRRVYFQEVLEHKLTTHRISGELIK